MSGGLGEGEREREKERESERERGRESEREREIEREKECVCVCCVREKESVWGVGASLPVLSHCATLGYWDCRKHEDMLALLYNADLSEHSLQHKHTTTVGSSFMYSIDFGNEKAKENP